MNYFIFNTTAKKIDLFCSRLDNKRFFVFTFHMHSIDWIRKKQNQSLLFVLSKQFIEELFNLCWDKFSIKCHFIYILNSAHTFNTEHMKQNIMNSLAHLNLPILALYWGRFVPSPKKIQYIGMFLLLSMSFAFWITCRVKNGFLQVSYFAFLCFYIYTYDDNSIFLMHMHYSHSFYSDL